MEQKNQAPVTPEEFEAMRQRYARELMAIRRSVDEMLDRNELLSRTAEEEPRRFDCQGDPVIPKQPEKTETKPENEVLSPDQIEDLAPSDGVEPVLDDTATIQVMVTAAQEAVPIEGAAVLISREENGTRTLLQAMLTDSSGKTPILTVPAPSRELTEAPGEVYPFVSYRVVVSAPGFLPQVNDNVTVFGGMASQLSVALQPMPQPQVPPPNSNTADGSLLF